MSSDLPAVLKRVLSVEDHKDLLSKFETVERSSNHGKAKDNYIDRIKKLADIYKV